MLVSPMDREVFTARPNLVIVELAGMRPDSNGSQCARERMGGGWGGGREQRERARAREREGERERKG